MIGHVDRPRPGERLENTVAVIGWVAWDEGVASIEVLVDDVVLGSASLGYERPDVRIAHPEYDDPNTGWVATIDLASVPPGIRWVTVRARSRTGTLKLLDSIPVMIGQLK